jgi:hypothetical protein
MLYKINGSRYLTVNLTYEVQVLLLVALHSRTHKARFTSGNVHYITWGDQKASVHLMITIQKATWLNLTALEPTARARGTLESH